MSDKEIENIFVSLSEFTCDDLDISFDCLVDEILKYINRLKERIANLEDKIENGTLVELSCKVGDDVFVIRTFIDNFGKKYQDIDSGFVKHIYLNRNNDLYIQVICWGKLNDFNCNGKKSLNFKANNVFTDKTQAEARLKELKGENV